MSRKTNGRRVNEMALSDFLKKINDSLLWKTNYTICVIHQIDPLYECPGMNHCDKCIGTWVNLDYTGRF